MNNTRCFFLCICALLGSANLRPIDEIEQKGPENEDLGQNRAGIGDVLNPQNWNVNNNKEGESGGIQNPFPNLLNRTQSQDDLLKEVKLFFLTVQGALMPASVITGGLGNAMQNLGNTGNVFGNIGQSLQNLNPLNQNSIS